MVAVISTGELYSWGHDGYGQLGLGVVINQGTVPRLIRGELETVRVTQVACGGHHTLALTLIGQVREGGRGGEGREGWRGKHAIPPYRFFPGAITTVVRLALATLSTKRFQEKLKVP